MKMKLLLMESYICSKSIEQLVKEKYLWGNREIKNWRKEYMALKNI